MQTSIPTPIGFHIIMRLTDSRVIAETVAALRAAASVMFMLGVGRLLVAFSVVDTHIHAIVLCDRVSAGRFAHDVEVAIGVKLKLSSRFEPARIRPIRDQHHLINTFWYVLRQAAHHGVTSDPLHEGSSLPDMLGLRLLGRGLRTLVRSRLPRVTIAALEQTFGIALESRAVALSLLADAAAAALGLPDLGIGGQAARRARQAAVVVAGAAVETAELARVLCISRRTVERYRHCEVAAELRNAVTLQLAARSAVQQARQAEEDGLAALSMQVEPVDLAIVMRRKTG
jgi:hypothetical protein